MAAYESHHYEFIRRFARIIGIIPKKGRRDKTFFVLIFLFLVPTFFAEIALIITSGYTKGSIIESMAVMAMIIILLTKQVASLLFYDKLDRLMQHMEEDWILINTDEELELMRWMTKKATRYIRRSIVSIVLAVVISGGVSSNWTFILDIVAPLNESRPPQLFIKVEYFIDNEKHFFILFLHITGAFLVGLIIIVVNDAMHVMFLCHGCSIFRICSWKFEHAYDEEMKLGHTDHWNYDDLRKKIGECVEYHRRTIKFANMITDMYGWPYFFQFIMIALSISVSLYSLSTSTEDMQQAIIYSTTFIIQMIQLFIVTYPSQKLANYSSNMLFSSYDSKWYAVPVISQKLFLLVMHRCLTPSVISVGKLFVFTTEQYMTLVQTSLSYFMVLRSIN